MTARRVAKLFGCFAHQVRLGLGRCEGSGPYAVCAGDALLQLRPGPDLPLLSLRPRSVQGPRGLECFIHCHEGPVSAAAPSETLVAVYRYGMDGQTFRHPSPAPRSLGILSDSDVAIRIVRTLVAEAYQRAVARDARRHTAAPSGANPWTDEMRS